MFLHCTRPLTIAVLIALLCPMLLAARARIPRDKCPGRATRKAVEAAAALAARPAEDWQAMEIRYVAGEFTLEDLAELRIHWAAEASPWYARSTWTLELMEAGLDAPTAVALPAAALDGDLESLHAVATSHTDAVEDPNREVLLLHTAALWGLGKEGNGALTYTRALEGDGVLAYYDTTVEEWLRGRAAEVLAGGEPTFLPADSTRAEALRAEFRGRGATGRLLLGFLQGVPLPAGGYTPSATLDEEVVAEMFLTRRMDLYFCYENAGGVSRLGNGTINMDLDVNPFGQVSFCAVQPASGIKERQLWDCTCRIASSLQFPCPEGAGKATVRPRLEFPIE